MKSEVKNCKNDKKDFTIEPEDFSFYEKIKVPPPTFCPECRLVRRLVWRNERFLYKRSCDLCHKKIISMYDVDTIFPVYCPKCWHSDDWNPLNHGQDYDFTKPFFEQFRELFFKVPRQALWQYNNCINSEYANFIQSVKNVYLSYSIIDSEDVYYSSNIDNSKNAIDSYNLAESELVYENLGCVKNYNCQYAYWSSNCIDCHFVLDCINCQNCFGCVNLRNKNYCIWNEQYSKEDYLQIMREFNLGSYEFVINFRDKFWNFSLKFPKKYSRVINCVNSTGDEIR